jgi:hypothetical protein
MLNETLETVDNKVAQLIEYLEDQKSISETDNDRETIQDFIDQFEDIRQTANDFLGY